MKACTAGEGIAASLENGMPGACSAKLRCLARMAGTCLRCDFCGVGCAPYGSERAASTPHQLQSRKDRDHGDQHDGRRSSIVHLESQRNARRRIGHAAKQSWTE